MAIRCIHRFNMRFMSPKQLENLARLVALHEAGHHVVARVNKFSVGECEITILGPPDFHKATSVIELCQPLMDGAEIIDYCERRVRVLYAGALAQSLTQKDMIDNDKALMCLRDQGGRTDYGRARDLIQLLRNIQHPTTTDRDNINQQLNDIDSRLYNQAAESVQEEVGCIRAVADELVKKVNLSNQTFKLAKEEIDKIPKIRRRFPSS